MVSRFGFTALVAAVALQRLFELALSRRNERRLRALGAFERAPEQLVLMKALHTAWLLGSSVEARLSERKVSPRLSRAALAAFAAGELLRLCAMRELGWRWNVRILALPHLPLVTTGVYRFLRHPNYAGVALEIAALPLVRGAYVSAAVFSLLNALLLRARIREERAALKEALLA